MGRELKIGNLIAKIPVVQGGMGVGISLSKLAGAVAKAGGIGIISTAQIGFKKDSYDKDPHGSNIEAIGEYIAEAKELAEGGIVGVNIMVATTGYEEYVRAAVKAGADIVVSGAGLPLNLPELVENSDTKIAPIVSSKKAAMVIVRQWQKHYNRLPDMIVIEGPFAGGHLGFSKEDIDSYIEETKFYETDSVSSEKDGVVSATETAVNDAAEQSVNRTISANYDAEIKQILDYIDEVCKENNVHIPVVVGGGVFDRSDADHYMGLGADGVQIATRFVATHECDADEKYKLAYINAKKEDVVIVKSPVGMPGRAIKNAFLERVKSGERIMGKCRHCVKTCNPATTPYCISQALINAAIGKVDEGLIFCGGNVEKIKNIVSVASIMAEFA